MSGEDLVLSGDEQLQGESGRSGDRTDGIPGHVGCRDCGMGSFFAHLAFALLDESSP